MGSMVIELLIIVLTKAKRDRFMQTIGTPRYCWFGSCDLSRCSCTMRGGGGGGGGGNFSWGELTQTGGQSVLGQHDDGATIFS